MTIPHFLESETGTMPPVRPRQRQQPAGPLQRLSHLTAAAATRTGSQRRQLDAQELNYPWQPRLNPEHHAAEAVAEAWCRAHNLLGSDRASLAFRRWNLGQLCGYAYPFAPAERLQLITKLMAWIFVENERYHKQDNSQPSLQQLNARFNRYLDILKAPHDLVPTSAAQSAWADLAHQLTAEMSPGWLARFEDSLRNYWFDGVWAECNLQRADHPKAPRVYLDIRAASIGARPFFDLIEYAHGLELTTEVRNQGCFWQLTHKTARLIAYVHDVFSYTRRSHTAATPNYLDVLCDYHGIALDSARARTIRCHNAEVMEFTELETAWLGSSEAAHLAAGRYANGLRHWMVGALAWHRVCPRFAEHPAVQEKAPTSPPAQ